MSNSFSRVENGADELLSLFQSRSADAIDRFELFYVYTRALYGIPPTQVPQLHLEKLATIAQDNNEQPLFRFHALSSLAYIDAQCGNLRNAATAYEAAIVLYTNLSAAERDCRAKGVHLKEDGNFDLQAQITSYNNDDGLDSTVGELVDREMEYVKVWKDHVFAELANEDRIERLGPTEAFVQDLVEKLGMNRETAKAFAEASESGALNSGNETPPSVTAAVIERVKQFPEEDESIYIELDPKYPQESAFYRIFAVDLKRYESGKQSKLFNQLGVGECKPDETRVKHIVSVFAMVCLQSLSLNAKDRAEFVPHRPKNVLIEAGNENSQVASFLSMMGCDSVSTIDSDLKEQLDKTRDSVMKQSVANQLDPELASTPHLRDHTLKIGCGNCKMTGRQLMVCPCQKAYFCNRKCLEAVWEQHKPEHKKEMARKKKAKASASADKNDG